MEPLSSIYTGAPENKVESAKTPMLGASDFKDQILDDSD
jgi:hypothetical protein